MGPLTGVVTSAIWCHMMWGGGADIPGPAAAAAVPVRLSHRLIPPWCWVVLWRDPPHVLKHGASADLLAKTTTRPALQRGCLRTSRVTQSVVKTCFCAEIDLLVPFKRRVKGNFYSLTKRTLAASSPCGVGQGQR